MSWANELVPAKVSILGLWQELRADNKAYLVARLCVRERAAFLFLRLMQRLFYTAGWRAGARDFLKR